MVQCRSVNLQNAKEILWMDGWGCCLAALFAFHPEARQESFKHWDDGIISIFEILDEKESIRPEKMRVHCIAW